MRRRHGDDGDQKGSEQDRLPRYSHANRRKHNASSRVGLRRLLGLVGFAVVALLVHETAYCVLLNRLDLGFPVSPSRIPNESLGAGEASVAVVSLHRGIKFMGYLGRWLSDQKRSYAKFQRYAYVDERNFPPEPALFTLSPWQQVYKRRVKFDKLRFLLYLMESFPNLEYLLWLDADSIVTRATVSVQERVKVFEQLRGEEFCFAWSEDGSPNTGVVLLRNTPEVRQLVRTSLMTYTETQTFMDQASFTSTVRGNKTYSSCQLLLKGDSSHLLQSRVRGRENMKWKPHDWILHLPNHNRLEMLMSLVKWLPWYSDEIQHPCQSLQPVPMPDLSVLDSKRRNRFEAVKEAIRHAWKGYQEHVLAERKGGMPHDDLNPVSRTGHSWLNYAATLHDSIDTLYLANMTDEFNEAVTMVTEADLQTTSLRVTKTFEYSLRVVGGLLGSYSLSGDPRLLAAARNSADALLDGPFRASPSALPRNFNLLSPSTLSGTWDWKAAVYRICSRLYEWGRDVFTSEHRTNSLAGAGSFGLEFTFLSAATQDPSYRRASDAVFDLVRKHERAGAIPTMWDVMTGLPLGSNRSSYNLGAAADSFHEYLLKIPLLGDCHKETVNSTSCSEVDRNMLQLYRRMVDQELRPNHINEVQLDGKDFQPGNFLIPVDGGRVYHHLLCFLPGLVALGSSTGASEDRRDMVLANDLLHGCHATYRLTPTGLGPESANLQRRFTQSGMAVASNSTVEKGPDNRRVHNPSSWTIVPGSKPGYLLRPEFVESLFVLYRTSKDGGLQDIGWDVFQSLEKFCRLESGGYSGLQDVFRDTGPPRVDDMPSYFIAETLKYLLLLFAPDDFISLDDFVFTTEAHPLRKLNRPTTSFTSPPLCVPRTNPKAPVPWSVLALLVSIVASLVGIGRVLFLGRTWCLRKSKRS